MEEEKRKARNKRKQMNRATVLFIGYDARTGNPKKDHSARRKRRRFAIAPTHFLKPVHAKRPEYIGLRKWKFSAKRLFQDITRGRAHGIRI